MDLNKFTIKSQQALQEAQTKAVNFGHQEVEKESTFCWPWQSSRTGFFRDCCKGM